MKIIGAMKSTVSGSSPMLTRKGQRDAEAALRDEELRQRSLRLWKVHGPNDIILNSETPSEIKIEEEVEEKPDVNQISGVDGPEAGCSSNSFQTISEKVKVEPSEDEFSSGDCVEECHTVIKIDPETGDVVKHSSFSTQHTFMETRNKLQNMVETGKNKQQSISESADINPAQTDRLVGTKTFNFTNVPICVFCGKKFRCRWRLETHVRSHTNEKPFYCEMCSQSFSTNSYLTLHRKRHLGVKNHVCELCDKRFVRKTELIHHERVHTGEKPYSCKLCPKSYSSYSGLKMHQIVHTNMQAFKCNKCNKKFTQFRYLKRHTLAHQIGNDRNFKCTKCSKCLKYAITLKRYDKCLHEMEACRILKCETCDKSFHEKSKLEAHTRTHTGEKPYKCGQCQQHFSLASNMRSHESHVHFEKTPPCQVCGKLFSTQGILNRHYGKTHDKTCCLFCDKSFGNSCNLFAHLRTHVGEKPFSCELCEVAYPTMTSLKRHMTSHSKRILQI